MKTIIVALLLLSLRAGAETGAMPEPTSVDLNQFTIEDTNGAKANFNQQKILIFISTGSSCPIMRRYTPVLQELTKNYAGSAQFYFVDSAAHDTRQAAASEADDFHFPAPTLMDAKQTFARALGFTMSTQAAVVNSSTREILYRGAIDDSLSYDGKKDPKHHYLKDALDAAISGRKPEIRTSRAYGCAITFKRD